VTGRTQHAFAGAPEWMAAEMPPGYQTRLLELQRLSTDLDAMDRIGRVLWETGEPLREAVTAVFEALKCEVDVTPGTVGPITVRAAGPIEKTNQELAQAFQAVQFAAQSDRVVFVVNNDPTTTPADRPDPFLPDALGVLQRMGVDVVTTATLFKLWRLWLEDQQKARKVLERLHSLDGGAFVLPSR
jgi:hypothetical protein